LRYCSSAARSSGSAVDDPIGEPSRPSGEAVRRRFVLGSGSGVGDSCTVIVGTGRRTTETGGVGGRLVDEASGRGEPVEALDLAAPRSTIRVAMSSE